MMQTFLPYPEFASSAATLDRQRLGKQRVESMQIARVLSGLTTGWTHHPAVRMWRGHLPALVEYGVAVCDEWTSRGYADTCRDKLTVIAHRQFVPGPTVMPPWLGDDEFHASHRSNLLRKFPEHYSQFGWSEPDDLSYVWPS